MEDSQYTLDKNLSIGEKRKLSIGIALIGGSEIIFLDEPSSWMDFSASRNLWEILKRQCDNKIIILTTHYMEEASILWKRIGIINLGKMKCLGTPLFLIEKFGKYMNVTLRKEDGAINDDICQFVKNIAPEVKLESLSEEILVRIEKSNFNNDYKNNNEISINKFFEELDSHLKVLKIKSYSVSMPTLEDVFLNVVQEDENNKLKLNVNKPNELSLYDLNYLNEFTRVQKFFSDFKSNFIRRFYSTIREKKSLIMEIFCPILLFLIGCIISKFNTYYPTPVFGANDIHNIGNQIIYYSSLDKSINMKNYFIPEKENVTNKNLNILENSVNQIENDKPLGIYKFISTIFNSTKNLENTIEKQIEMNNNNYIGCYGNFLLLNEPNELNKNYEFVELINTRVLQGVSLFTSAFLEQIIRKDSNNKVSINFKHKVMGRTYKQENNSDYSSNNVVIFMAIAYSMIPSNIIALIVKERINNSKHLMKLSGKNIFSYWIVNFSYEIIKFYFTGGICLLILYLFNYYEKCLTDFYLLYGPPIILMTYVASFLFNDESDAQFKIILLHSLTGALGSTLILFFRQVEKTKSLGKVLEFILCFIPSFTFCFSYNLSRNIESIYFIICKNELFTI